jgi:hypothetical protein
VHATPELVALCAVALFTAGRVTGTTRIAGSNFTLGDPNTYSYTHTVKAMEALNFTGTLCLASASVQRDGSTMREYWSTGGPALAQVLTAHSWHLLYLPFVINGRFGSTYADPKLGARMVLSMPVTYITTNSSNATIVTETTEQAAFDGFWSSSNGSYVVPFKLSALGNISGVVHLLSNTSANISLVRALPWWCCSTFGILC